MDGIKRSRCMRIDYITISIVTVLILFGLVSLLNVTSDPFDGTETTMNLFLERLNFEYFSRQLVNILVSVTVAVPIAMLDYQKYKPFIKTIYFVCCLLLAFLVIAGEETRGILGWYKIETSSGTRGFQPSELTKVVLIVILSKFCGETYDRRGGFSKFTDVLIAFVYFAVPFILVILQRDLGTAMVLLVIFVAIVFSARISWGYVAGGALVSAVCLPLVYFFLLSKSQKSRIRVFLDPSLDLLGEGHNVYRAKEMIGSGGMWGKGMFTPGTLSQTGYVPERQTDFIFSGIGEALGFIGGLTLVLLYLLLLIRWIYIAWNARDTYGRCLVVGCSAMLAVHVFENIGMNMGVMPVTGIPLPLISYGGSNMMATIISVAIVISVHYRTHVGRRT